MGSAALQQNEKKGLDPDIVFWNGVTPDLKTMNQIWNLKNIFNITHKSWRADILLGIAAEFFALLHNIFQIF